MGRLPFLSTLIHPPTHREALLFTARLRLSKRMTDAEKRAYVEQMIFRMGLTEVGDTLVGDEKKRGISGGERKRLSLACELMGNPSKVVFADEPTSGLDSFQAQSVMSSMKKLCEEGVGHTVIVSIHQPRRYLFYPPTHPVCDVLYEEAV